MHQSTFSQRSPVSLAVLAAICVAASGASAQEASYSELLQNTQYTLGSTIASEQPSVNWTPECTNAGECVSYTGTQSEYLLTKIYPPHASDNEEIGSLSPFYEENGVDNGHGRTLLVSSLAGVRGMIYAYSNANTYIYADYPDEKIPSTTASADTLVIDLGNGASGTPVKFSSADYYNNDTIASVAAAGIIRGGAQGNQMLMRDSSILVQADEYNDRPGWHMAAASVYWHEKDSSDNTTILDNVSIAMDPTLEPSERSYVRIGALYAKSVYAGTLNDNHLWISDSSIAADSLYGVSIYSAMSSENSADRNSVYVSGSTLWLNPTSNGNRTAGIYAVRNADKASANWTEVSNSSLTIIKGESGSDPFMMAPVIGAAVAKDNTLILRDTNIQTEQNLYLLGAYAYAAAVEGGNAATGNSVFVGGTDGDMQITGSGYTNVFGGSAYATDAANVVANQNSVLLTKLSAPVLLVRGGRVFKPGSSAAAVNGEVAFNDVVLADVDTDLLQVWGGSSAGGSVRQNKVYVTELNLAGSSEHKTYFFGGQSEGSGVVEGNQIFIEDSRIGRNAFVYGGYVVADGEARDNLVVIGSNVTAYDGSVLNFGQVVGGIVNGHLAYDGNRLVTASRFETQVLGGFQHYEFVVGQQQFESGPFVSVTGEVPVVLMTSGEKATTVGVGLSGGRPLDQDSSYTLIHSAAGFVDEDGVTQLAAGSVLDAIKTSVTTTQMPSIVRIDSTTLAADDYNLAIDATGSNLVMTVLNSGTTTSEVNPETDALLESSISTLTTHIAADDLFVDSVLRSRDGRREGLFAAARAGSLSFDTRTRIKTNIVSGLMGYGAKLSENLNAGAFIEMGNASYDTRTELAEGTKEHDGSHNYGGLGVFADYAVPALDGLHLTGYLKVGLLRNKFSSSLTGERVDYNRTGAYWGAHLGAHYDFSPAEVLRSRVFVSYFYDGQGDESFSLPGSGEQTGTRITYDAVNAHRVQAGTLLEFVVSDTTRPYLGLTIEQTLSAKARGTAQDEEGALPLNSSGLEGATGILSAGWTYAGAGGFSCELGLTGYAGTRNGVSGQIQGNWKF